MTRTRRLLPLLTLCALALAACDKTRIEPVVEEETEELRYENVDPELQSYFAAYEAAAAERGIVVDLSAMNLTGHLERIGASGVAGECNYIPDDPNRVTVDEDTWRQVGESLREYIVFHELGHCERLRGHRETADADGRCVSIMASGTGDCRENYGRSTREAHLDELFDERFYDTWP